MRACVRMCVCERERKMGRRLKEGLLDEEGVSERVREREGGRGRERLFPESNACVIITVSSVGGSHQQQTSVRGKKRFWVVTVDIDGQCLFR